MGRGRGLYSPCLTTAWYREFTTDGLMKSARSLLRAVSRFRMLAGQGRADRTQMAKSADLLYHGLEDGQFFGYKFKAQQRRRRDKPHPLVRPVLPSRASMITKGRLAFSHAAHHRLFNRIQCQHRPRLLALPRHHPAPWRRSKRYLVPPHLDLSSRRLIRK